MNKKYLLNDISIPLAEKLRPQTVSEIVGQPSLIGTEGSITKLLAIGNLRSMILWGPPGVGKTTLARVLAKSINADILEFSGARAQIKELRDQVDKWFEKKYPQINNSGLFKEEQKSNIQLIVFVDEIHRYNKAQQDYFLPWVEQGLFILIGATTENPAFEINNALLSRCLLMRLNTLSHDDLQILFKRAVNYLNIAGLLNQEAIEELIIQADGDARRLFNDIEIVYLAIKDQKKKIISRPQLKKILNQSIRRFDKGGDLFYDQISALHKSLRGSDPDAALYWFIRMIDGGCDPLYIARRMIRMASEDIGLADPQALTLTISATKAYERLGNPEGLLAIAEAIIYLAVLPKSNSVYTAFNQAKEFVANNETHEVPMHIRNAPTKVHKNIGAGKNYRYPHDEENAYAAGENYWPTNLKPQKWYLPTDRGLEQKINERLKNLALLDQNFFSKVKLK